MNENSINKLSEIDNGYELLEDVLPKGFKYTNWVPK